MFIINYLLSQPEMQVSVEPLGLLGTYPNNADASFLAFILILAFITGLLFFILFLFFSHIKEQKKLVTLIEKLSAESDNKSKAETLGDKPEGPTYDEGVKIGGITLEDMPKLGGEIVAWGEMPKLLKKALNDNEELVADRNELCKQLNCLRKELEHYKNTIDDSEALTQANADSETEVLVHENADNDAEVLIRYFARKQVSASKEGIRFIVENGRQWLDELNTLKIENEDNRISLYLLMNTLVEMAKLLRQNEDFLEDVFQRYASFIRNPGGLHVRDNKSDKLLFLKNSLEMSVLFRDFIRRRNEPEQFQPGKQQNINFEMIASGITPAQINAPQHNRRFDGSDIPSNLLAYSLICNMYGIDELNVFISGDKIQKNIR